MEERIPLYTGVPKGFTLIELLVVIAIIGILSSIVLLAIGNARSTGSDASIKANLSTIRSQAELYALMNGNSYGVFNGGGVPPLARGPHVGAPQSKGDMVAGS